MCEGVDTQFSMKQRSGCFNVVIRNRRKIYSGYMGKARLVSGITVVNNVMSYVELVYLKQDYITNYQ